MNNMDSYTKVCEICENIKGIYCEFGSEVAVMNMANAIINEARRRKESFVNNTYLKLQHHIANHCDQIVINHDEAKLLVSLLKKSIEQVSKEGWQE